MSKNSSFLGKMRGWLGGKSENPELELPAPVMTIPEVVQRQTQPPRPSPTTSNPIDPIYLRQQISNHLDMAQLASLAEGLGVDPASFSGGKGRRVLQLVETAEASNHLPQLLAACEALNPSVSWQMGSRGSVSAEVG